MTVEPQPGRPGLLPTVLVLLSGAGVTAALTLVFLGMRAVMDVGGACGEGGPYVIRQHCPEGIPAIMVGGIWGGLILTGVYVYALIRYRIPGLVTLIWPALFLSLGWNFLQYGVDPPGDGGIVWGWLVCGVVFVLMGGVPLVLVAPSLVRTFARGEPPPAGWRGGLPVDRVRRVASRASVRRPVMPDGDDLATALERLDALHRSGALDDDEFEDAKRRVIDGGAGP